MGFQEVGFGFGGPKVAGDGKEGGGGLILVRLEAMSGGFKKRIRKGQTQLNNG